MCHVAVGLLVILDDWSVCHKYCTLIWMYYLVVIHRGGSFARYLSPVSKAARGAEAQRSGSSLHPMCEAKSREGATWKKWFPGVLVKGEAEDATLLEALKLLIHLFSNKADSKSGILYELQTSDTKSYLWHFYCDMQLLVTLIPGLAHCFLRSPTKRFSWFAWKVPDKFAAQLVMEQLTCSGVFEVPFGPGFLEIEKSLFGTWKVDF